MIVEFIRESRNANHLLTSSWFRSVWCNVYRASVWKKIKQKELLRSFGVQGETKKYGQSKMGLQVKSNNIIFCRKVQVKVMHCISCFLFDFLCKLTLLERFIDCLVYLFLRYKKYIYLNNLVPNAFKLMSWHLPSQADSCLGPILHLSVLFCLIQDQISLSTLPYWHSFWYKTSK